jgi:hypothetical protein
MFMRTTSSSATAIAAAASILIFACSTSNSPAPGDSTPDGSTPVTNTGLTGCSTLEPGCFTTGNAAYTGPSPLPACSQPGAPELGTGDTHCNGVRPQTVNPASCGITTQKDAGTAADAGPAPTPGVCGENGPDYGATMDGTEGDDDDCKYHVSYSVTPICENDGFYFTVKADYLTRGGAPLTGACTFAELCLNDTHPAPASDARPPGGNQQVVEGPPGTYTIGPVLVDEPGTWTVRFHFNEICCDVAADSPHGHAAFHLSVP